jgi:hypothetical protein
MKRLISFREIVAFLSGAHKIHKYIAWENEELSKVIYSDRSDLKG